MEHVALTFGILHSAEPLYCRALLSREAMSSLFAGRDVGARDKCLEIRRLLQQIFREQDETSGSRFGRQRGTIKYSKLGLKPRPQIFERRLDHPVWYLFCADFEKKIRHYA